MKFVKSNFQNENLKRLEERVFYCNYKLNAYYQIDDSRMT